jgi:periplasmic copper chaperone A
MFKQVAVGGLILAGAAVVGSGVASAHVTVQEDSVAAGEFAVVTIAVPHGCEESPTTQVRIQMPETIPGVTPTINAGWDVEKVMETLAEPIQGEHGEITERVSEVVYTAKTPLPDGYRDTFALSIKVPDDASGLMFFPTVQICEVGESDWIEIPADGQDPFELEKPSPFVNVVASTDSADAATGGDTVTDGESADEATTDIVVDEVAAESASDDDGTNGLAIAALVVGLLGLGTGAVAIVRTRKA